jgi:hypothetical protein
MAADPLSYMFCPPHRTQSVNTNVICVSFWIDLNLHIYPLLLHMFTHCILAYILLLSHKLGMNLLVFLSSRFLVFLEFRLVGNELKVPSGQIGST